MKTLKPYIFCLFLLASINSFAQVTNQQQYLNAKELFNTGKYSLAMEAFKPLMQDSPDNPFPAYASFYYAIAAYEDGYTPLAKNMFLQIREKFPKWSKMDEVNFWLGKLYFESEEYNQGLNMLSMVKGKAFQDNIGNLKYQAFAGIQDIKRLKQLYENHPNEKAIGEMLAVKISQQALVNQDQKLLDKLIKNFDLDEKGLKRVQVDKSVFKDSYKVAVLFPFLMNNLDADTRKKVNQVILDVYHGMRLALDTLNDEGLKIELYAYDTKRDSSATAKILERDELKGMDLIVGPFFSEPRRVIQEFSFKNKINMISPLSSDSEVIGVNPYSLLLQPSNETQGRRMADYVSKHARNKTGIIFYGDSERDSVMAYSYKERIEEAGFDIIITKEIKKQDTREVLDILIANGRIKEASSEAARGGYKLAPDSVGHIFVASNNDLISTKVISAVDTRGDSIMVVGSADWLELPVINYDSYRRLGTVLYAPMYVPKDTEAYRNFREKYVGLHRVPPTSYAEIGYDLMLLTGRSMNKYGKYFQLGWNKEKFLEGNLTIGYSFKDSQDNQLVPILEFGDEGLMVIYELEEDNK